MSGEKSSSSADKCYKCDNIAYDDCAKCGKPTCRKHGKLLAGTDTFACYDDIDEER